MTDSRNQRIAAKKRALSAHERARSLEAKVVRDEKTIRGLQNRLTHLEAAQTAVVNAQQSLPQHVLAVAQGLVFPNVWRVLTRGTTTNDPQAAVENASKSNGAYTGALRRSGVLSLSTVDASALLGPGSPFYRLMPDGRVLPTLRNGPDGRLEEWSDDRAGNNDNLWMPVYALNPLAWLDEKARLETEIGHRRAAARDAAARAALIRSSTRDQVFARLPVSAVGSRSALSLQTVTSESADEDQEWGLFEMPLPGPSGRH